MKLCKDCKYYKSDLPNFGIWESICPPFTHPSRWHMCSHPELVSPVSGAPSQAEEMRNEECGKNAKYWEAKD